MAILELVDFTPKPKTKEKKDGAAGQKPSEESAK
jgi:hypothetical protein